MDVRARILNHTLFGAAKFHYIQKNKFLKIENNFQKFKKKSRAIALNSEIIPHIQKFLWNNSKIHTPEH